MTSYYFYLHDTGMHADIGGSFDGGNIIPGVGGSWENISRGNKNVNPSSNKNPYCLLMFENYCSTNVTCKNFILKMHLIHDGGTIPRSMSVNTTDPTNTYATYDSRLYPLAVSSGNTITVPLTTGKTSGDLVHTDVMMYYQKNTETTFNWIRMVVTFTQDVTLYGGSYIQVIPTDITGVGVLE